MNNRGPRRPEDFKNTKTTTSKSKMIIKYAIISVLMVITIFIVSVTIISLIKKN